MSDSGRRIPDERLFELTDEDRARLAEHGDDGRIVLGMSGGKDSAAAALMLEHNGVTFTPVFLDTGWEHPVTYDYVRGPLAERFGPVTELRSSKYAGMADLVRKRQAFPSRRMRFCTQELKFFPLRDHLLSLDEDVINVIEIRRAESLSRSQSARWDFDASLDATVWRPLVEHSFDDIIAMHHAKALAPNPLYLQGASRVGCFPCIHARKSEVSVVADIWPSRAREVSRLERELTDNFAQRMAQDDAVRASVVEKARTRAAFLAARADGVECSWSDWRDSPSLATTRTRYAKDENDATVVREIERLSRRTFFHARGGDDAPDPWFDEVVEWSRTDRGGKQFRLFDYTARDGCTRWGLCDSADPELVQIEDKR